MASSIVILNARAGTLLDGGIADPRRLVESTFGDAGREVDVVLAEPRDLTQAITRAATSHYDEVIVGGGDGTVSSAVAHLAGTDKALGVLPLGTLNLLAGDFGMPNGLEAAVRAIVKAERQRMDLGQVNGRWFHTVSGIGFFSQMARAREETRGVKLPLGRYVGTVWATWRAIARMGRFELSVEVEGQTKEVEAHSILVTNNRFVGGPRWRRERLDEGKLEVHIAHDSSGLQTMLMGADVITGTWRNNPTIETFAASRLTILARRRRRMWVATDGEMSREGLPMRYECRPQALSVLLPPQAPERSERAEHATVEPRTT